MDELKIELIQMCALRNGVASTSNIQERIQFSSLDQRKFWFSTICEAKREIELQMGFHIFLEGPQDSSDSQLFAKQKLNHRGRCYLNEVQMEQIFSVIVGFVFLSLTIFAKHHYFWPTIFFIFHR